MECDGCNVRLLSWWDDSFWPLIDKAQAIGWERPGEKDLCPNCAAKPRETGGRVL